MGVALDEPRASIRRTIEPAKIALSQLYSLATCTLSPQHLWSSSFFSLPDSLPVTIYPKTPFISHNMLPNNVETWAPPHRKPFPSHKSPNPCSPRTHNLPPPKPCHYSLPSTLPPPKHHLSPRPPAEVCVYIDVNSQSCTPSSSQFQSPETSAPKPIPNAENSSHGITPPNNSASPHALDLDPMSGDGLQNDTSVPFEPLAFQGDLAQDGRSSPSISSSGDALEEFLRLPDVRDNIPIDPRIVTSDGSWGDTDFQPSVPQADSLVNSGTICSYPDRPPVLHHAPHHYRARGEMDGDQNSNIQTRDHPHIHDGQQDTDPHAIHPNDVRENHYVSGQSKSSKRKTKQSNGPACKRLRLPSALPSRKDSFTALRSFFMSLPLGERSQFLSWLFEAALPQCMSDSSPIAYEDGRARATCRVSSIHTDRNQRDRNEARGPSRKSRKWSPEETDHLRKLRKDRSRPRSEVTKLFSEKYPGRSPGAIQVFWCTTLNKDGG